jgi:hypothetical protein
MAKALWRPEIRAVEAEILTDYLNYALNNKPDQIPEVKIVIKDFLDKIGGKLVLADLAPSIYRNSARPVHELTDLNVEGRFERITAPSLNDYKDMDVETLQRYLDSSDLLGIPADHITAIQQAIEVLEVREAEQKPRKISPPKPTE